MHYTIQRSDERGSAEHGWLQSRFSFSFAEYRNLERMGFGPLRVINDDTIAPESGFGMHPHRDMEIITIVTQGSVEHEDSMGHHGTTSAWEVQCMSAGSGVMHSEFNPSDSVPLQLFQIWIHPREKNITPAYAQKRYGADMFEGNFLPIASGLGSPGALHIHQDAEICRGRFGTGESLSLLPKCNGLYLFVIDGSIKLEGETLGARDAIAFTDAQEIQLNILEASDLLLFHLRLA